MKDDIKAKLIKKLKKLRESWAEESRSKCRGYIPDHRSAQICGAHISDLDRLIEDIKGTDDV